VGWWGHRTGTTDVYAQRVTPAGDIATGWAADGVAVSKAAGDQFAHAIASDGIGGANL
jgi:hypothetical protein